jgi:predicted MFS family arabinose efflux permease
VVLAWSLLSVGGTALTAERSPIGEGEALGLFNAASALASVIGAALGGWIAGRWGVAAAPALALLGTGCALVFAAGLDLVKMCGLLWTRIWTRAGHR